MSYSFEQLIMFEAVSRLGSFTLAAQEVYRAKSAVSHGVRALEESLGLKLLERSTRSVKLTAEGELIINKVHQILHASHILEQLAKDLNGEHEANLTLVVDGAAPVNQIMKAVRQLTQMPIETKIKVIVEHLHKVRDRFESEQACMMVTFGFSNVKDLENIELPPVELILVAHKDHPLAGYTMPLAKSSLKEFIELSVADCIDDPLRLHNDLSFSSDHLIEVSDFSLKKQALLGAVGFGWLPRHLIEDELKTGTLVPLKLIDQSNRWLSPQLVYRNTPPLGTVGRNLLKRIKEGMTS